MVLKIHVRVGCKRPSRRLKKTPLQSFNKSLAMYVVSPGLSRSSIGIGI